MAALKTAEAGLELELASFAAPAAAAGRKTAEAEADEDALEAGTAAGVGAVLVTGAACC